MLSVADARTRMLDVVAAGAQERVPLEGATGRVLAAPIIATREQPPFRASSMDGYAARAADTPGRLRVVGESAAGRGYPHGVGAGEAVRISTGAPVPTGADTILIQEDVRREPEDIEAPAGEAGQHIRNAGIDFTAGDQLLEAGRVLDATALTLAAAAGQSVLDVIARPRVTIFSGGDEIVLPGAAPQGDQVFDSARYGVAAMIEAWGATPRLTPLLRDDRAAVFRAVDYAFSDSDLLVMIGGASVGDHDHARAAFADLGAAFLVDKIAVRPGKPTWFARCGAKPVLGLPGNPASALVCARLFLRPLIDRMLGRDPAPSFTPEMAHLHAPLRANGPRESYLRARAWRDAQGLLWADARADQDSSLMRVLANSNCLIIQPPNAAQSPQGALAPTLPF